MPDQLETKIFAMLSDRRMRGLRDYLQNGRRFGDADAAALKERWVGAFRAYVADPSDSAARHEVDEIDAELTMRDEEPPFSVVAAEMEELVRIAEAAVVELKKSPKKFAEANQQILDEAEAVARQATEGGRKPS